MAVALCRAAPRAELGEPAYRERVAECGELNDPSPIHPPSEGCPRSCPTKMGENLLCSVEHLCAKKTAPAAGRLRGGAVESQVVLRLSAHLPLRPWA